jgi:hypothetical protein
MRWPDKIYIDWRDLWTGAYIDPQKRRTYVVLVPTVVMRWNWR